MPRMANPGAAEGTLTTVIAAGRLDGSHICGALLHTTEPIASMPDCVRTPAKSLATPGVVSKGQLPAMMINLHITNHEFVGRKERLRKRWCHWQEDPMPW